MWVVISVADSFCHFSFEYVFEIDYTFETLIRGTITAATAAFMLDKSVCVCVCVKLLILGFHLLYFAHLGKYPTLDIH